MSQCTYKVTGSDAIRLTAKQSHDESRPESSHHNTWKKENLEASVRSTEFGFGMI